MVSDEGHHLKVELFQALAGFLTIFIAIALVVGVVFVFLQNWRATIIPVVAIPISLVGTFPVLAAFGTSINNLSLFGLVVAVGIVDDAIVVVENVEVGSLWIRLCIGMRRLPRTRHIIWSVC